MLIARYTSGIIYHLFPLTIVGNRLLRILAIGPTTAARFSWQLYLWLQPMVFIERKFHAGESWSYDGYKSCNERSEEIRYPVTFSPIGQPGEAK